MKLLRWYFGSNLLIRILIGLAAGSLAGIVFGPGIGWVSPLGDVFVRLLKFIVMPVVLFTLVVGAASIHPARLGRVGLKAMLLYTVTTGFAMVIGLMVGNVFKPGQGMKLVGTAGAGGMKVDAPSLLQTVLEIVPLNPFKAITVFLIVDNLKVHHSKPVKEWLEAHEDQIEIFFLPPYCPEFNPDEYLNGDLKSGVYKAESIRTRFQLTKKTISHLRSLQRQPQRVKKFFCYPKVAYAA